MATYTGISGITHRAADKPFAGGGEGDIFYIIGNPNIVAKIYKADKRTTERERKLSAMVKIKPSVIDQYSWPLDVLYENGRFAGYIMPKIVGKEKLRNIYVYDKRKGNPWTLYLAIAKNLSSTVYNVHEIGQVVGDLNPENILVNPQTGFVTLVDTDSYHITETNGTVHRCGVGMPEYVAPELQGKHFPSAPLPTFTKETDLFSLAVLLFSLLMNGAHPFACKTISGSSSKFQPIDNLSSGTCAYFAESSAPNIDIPRYAPELESLPQELQNMFKRTFVNGHKNPKLRPTADEYYNALENLENNIKVCGVNSEHLYYYHAAECPWCKVDQKMKSIGQSSFNAGSMPSGSGSQTYAPRNPPIQSVGYKFTPSRTQGNPVKSNNNNWWKPIAGVAAVIVVILIIVNIFSGKETPIVPDDKDSSSVSTTNPSSNTANSTAPETQAHTQAPRGLQIAAIDESKKEIANINDATVTLPPIVQSYATNIKESINNYSGSISSQGQTDEYRFSASVSGRHRFEISGLPSGVQVGLAVYNPGGQRMDYFSSRGNGNGLTLSLNAGETYRIEVKHSSGNGSYNLMIGERKPTLNVSTATVVSDSVQYTEQLNAYSFTPSVSGRHRFEMSELPSGVEVGLAISNPGGERMDYFSSRGNGYGITINLNAGEAYEIRVTQASGTGAYSLLIGYRKPTVDVSSATIISDSLQYTEQLNAYSFIPTVTGRHRFELSGLPSGVEVGLAISNPGGERMDYFSSRGNGYGITISLNAGEAYEIRITQSSGTGSYALLIGCRKPTVDVSSATIVSDSLQYTEQLNAYSFTPTVTGRHRFEISGLPSGVEVGLAVYNPGNQRMDYFSSRGNGYGLTISLNAGELYEIRVTQASGTGAYNLVLGHKKPDVDISKETIVEDSVQYFEQLNCYEFTPSISSNYKFEISGMPDGMMLGMQVDNPGGQRMDYFSSKGSGNSLTVALNANETYRIYIFQSAKYGNYKLNFGRL